MPLLKAAYWASPKHATTPVVKTLPSLVPRALHCAQLLTSGTCGSAEPRAWLTKKPT